MTRKDDLDAAAARGIVSVEQAATLEQFFQDKAQARAAAQSHEERFRFMRGFNDFFFAVGILLFLSGLTFFTIGMPATALGAALATWALAELLVARMRLVLPGILLSCFFVVFFAAGTPAEFVVLPSQFPSDLQGFQAWLTTPRLEMIPIEAAFRPMLIVYTLSGAFAALTFYARFRLPFALLPAAACLIGAALAWALRYPPAELPFILTIVLLISGIVVFAAAMAFDISDRERATRRADCAFWLHLLAAPLIVHSLVTLVRPDSGTMTSGTAAATVAIFAALSLVALVIDRRALLVSGLSYFGLAVAYGLEGSKTSTTSAEALIFFKTILVVGAFVLLIGVGWRPLRRLLLRLLPSGVVRILPPALSGRTEPEPA